MSAVIPTRKALCPASAASESNSSRSRLVSRSRFIAYPIPRRETLASRSKGQTSPLRLDRECVNLTVEQEAWHLGVARRRPTGWRPASAGRTGRRPTASASCTGGRRRSGRFCSGRCSGAHARASIRLMPGSPQDLLDLWVVGCLVLGPILLLGGARAAGAALVGSSVCAVVACMAPQREREEYREPEAGMRSPSFEIWDRICKPYGWPRSLR
jgi:hypothetical protein